MPGPARAPPPSLPKAPWAMPPRPEFREGAGASLAQLLTLAEKKASYLISLLAESERGCEVRVRGEDNLVANAP